MAGVRRPAMAAVVERRLAERRGRLGGDVRSARVRRHWSQAELAERAGIGRLVVSRIERGIGRIDLEAVERVSVALDVALVLALGRDPREDVADAGHLAMQELVLRAGRAAGFDVQFELGTRPAEPWRSIDVALGSARMRIAIVIECWNTIGDIGAGSRSTSRKEAELEAAALARWGPDARARSLWVVRATARNRSIVARYPQVFATRFPGSSRGWVATVTTGSEPPDAPGLVWCDVGATRIFGWRRG